MDKFIKLNLVGSILLAQALFCCSTMAKEMVTRPEAQALVIEPEPPATTQYRFSFSCPREKIQVVVEGRDYFAEGTGQISEVSRVNIDTRELDADQLALINKGFPMSAVQERPWITCDEKKVQLSIPYRFGGGKKDMLRFVIDSNGRVVVE